MLSSGGSKLLRIRIWKAITYIIHNRNVDIIRDTQSREALFKGWQEVILSNIPQEYFPAIAVVRSEEGTILFPVSELIATTAYPSASGNAKSCSGEGERHVRTNHEHNCFQWP